MKSTVIAQKEVQDVLKGFVFAELYTDATPWKEANSKLLRERFKTAALPLYVTLGPDGQERSRLEGLNSAADFLKFLRKGLDQTSQGPPPLQRAATQAATANRLLLVRFSNVTDLNSIWMAEKVMKAPRVREKLASFEEAELWTDCGPDARTNRALMVDRFKCVAHPTYVILGPEGEERAKISGIRTEDEILAFLDAGAHPPHR